MQAVVPMHLSSTDIHWAAWTFTAVLRTRCVAKLCMCVAVAGGTGPYATQEVDGQAVAFASRSFHMQEPAKALPEKVR